VAGIHMDQDLDGVTGLLAHAGMIVEIESAGAVKAWFSDIG